MSNEPTIEQMNEVIALFDGWQRYEDKFGIWFKRGELIKCLHPKLQDLQYHKSWDALMPVVKKIRGMHMDILQRIGIGEYMHAAAPMNSALLSYDIEKMHLGVYNFLIWYNQQTSTNGLQT